MRHKRGFASQGFEEGQQLIVWSVAVFGDASPRSELLGDEVSTRKITSGGTVAC
jgi:hypothetical protein